MPREGWIMIPADLAWTLPGEQLGLYARIKYRDRGEGCWASLADLRGPLSERQTRRHLHALRDRKLIAIIDRPGATLSIRVLTPDTDVTPDMGVTPDTHVPTDTHVRPARTWVSAPPDTHVRTPRTPMSAKVDPRSRSSEVDPGSRSPDRAGGSATAPAPGLVLTPPCPKEPKPAAVSAATWAAYAAAYRARYGADPVRNTSVNSKLAQLVARLGTEEAPQVAAFYVGHGDAFYVRVGHAVGPLVKDAEKLRTEWATGRKVNAELARQNEKTAGNAAWHYALELEEKEQRKP